MKSFRLALLALAIVVGILSCHRGNEVKELNFDIGSSVEQTLRPHKIPYKGDNTGGLIEYYFMGFPDDSVGAVFDRPGMDIRIFPIFAISYYLDDQASPANTITSANMSMSTNALRSHEKAYATTNQLIDQFQRGKWQRFIPNSCPHVTGRSTLLGPSGTVEDRDVSCPVDPSIKLTFEEFSGYSNGGLVWMWIADNRIAKIDVSSSSSGTPNVHSYSIDLSFELKEARDFYDAQWYIDRKKDRGEANFKQDQEELAAEIKQLEEAAIKRGDSVLPRP